MTFHAGSTSRHRPRSGHGPRSARCLTAIAAGLLLVVSGGATAMGASPVEPPDEPLGSDATLDAAVIECAGGDLAACDQLFRDAPLGSGYEEYGDTCGGRQPAGTPVLCIEADLADTPPATVDVPPTSVADSGAIPPPTIEPAGLGDDPALDAFAERCYGGDMGACDALYRRSPPGSDYRSYADSCAGRQDVGSGNWCEQSFPGEPTPDATLPADVEPVDTAPGATTPADSAPVETPSPAEPSTVDPEITTWPPSVGSDDVPPPSIEPTGLGDDAEMNALAAQCYAGDLEACDDLFRAATLDDASAYRDYADRCAGRQPASSGRWCTEMVTAEDVEVEDPAPITSEPGTSEPGTSEPGTSEPVSDVRDEIPAPTIEPVGLGDDPELDALAQACFDGDLFSCDELFELAVDPEQFDYSVYADTCAGRQPTGTGRWCVDLLDAPGVTMDDGATPPDGLGDDPALDSLANECYRGDMVACDELFRVSPFRSAYEEYGDTCAGRQEPGTFRYCTAAFPALGVRGPG